MVFLIEYMNDNVSQKRIKQSFGVAQLVWRMVIHTDDSELISPQCLLSRACWLLH